MRISNRNRAGVYNFIHTVLLMFLFAGVGLFFLKELRSHWTWWKGASLIIVPLAILILFYLTGRQIFEYDSDGEALNFKNRNILPFLERPANDEFPKYKVIKYELVNFPLFRRLYITIKSKKNKSTVLKYDISYLKNKEVRDLQFSLGKVVKANREKIERAKA